jgi:2-oxoglutarate ferredoxin oxidoreductase subunit gamma
MTVKTDFLNGLPESIKIFKIPATQIAREHFRVVVANNVMLGFVCRKTAIIDKECIQAAILKSAPPGTEEMNIAAFNKGYDWEVGA